MFKKERSIKYLKNISIVGNNKGMIYMSEKEKTKRISEKLIVNELGYVKIPSPVKDKFGTPTKYPNPDWEFAEDKDTFRVTYIFDKQENDRIQNKKGE